MVVVKSRGWLKRIVFVAIALLAAIACLIFQPNRPALKASVDTIGKFERVNLQDQLFRVFDLGVTDVNGDGKLDIYTSNHSNEQFLLMNQGQGKFSDNQIIAKKLYQDPEFPGLEYSLKKQPKFNKPGLYIYWKDRRLNIEAHQLNNPAQFSGNISVAAPLKIQTQRGLESELTLSPFGEDEVGSSLNFQANTTSGKLTFLPGNVALPFIFQLDETVPLDQVFVGLESVSPQKNRFDLFMRDRHGMAWRDVNNDGNLDVFIVRGALKGRIDKLPGTFADELLVQKNNVFEESIDPNSIQKGNCPALQTAWVDANRDDRLDIFTLCYKPTTPIQTFPPQLYVQGLAGKYQEQSNDLKLDQKADGSFLWVDADDDGDLDLFRSTSEAFILFRNEKEGFSKERIAKNPGGVAKTFNGSNNLNLADFDHDGDLDIFAASEQGNALLVANQGSFEMRAPESLGLPAQSLTAQWVDFDNDGRMDLFSVPEGLFQQSAAQQFTATGILKNQNPQGVLEARSTWFDADNDGDRDLATTLNFRDPPYRRLLIKGLKRELTPNGWFLDEYLNQTSNQNHWLELDLRGLEGNAEAIGAQVDVDSDLGTQRYQVGQSEGSHYSQGHYRLYIGLGEQKTPITLNIRWPNGSVQSQKVINFDQRIALTQAA